MKKSRSPVSKDEKRLFVIDTNVLVHDPSALFRFKEHDIYLPMVVLEELDQGKKGLSDTARNIREVNRYLDGLIKNITNKEIFDGIPLIFPGHHMNKAFTFPTGKLFFQREEIPSVLPASLPGNKPDNSILATVLSLQAKHQHTRVTLVSKDINMRIKGAVLGIHAEDYHNDQVLDDLDLMYSGIFKLTPNFWEKHGKEMASWKEDGKTFYKIQGEAVLKWFSNLCLSNDGDFEAIVRQVDGDVAKIEYAKDYRRHKNKVCGINARNPEQNFALNLLMDPDIDFVTLVGAAGTGKTLLTMAAGLAQTVEHRLYREIIMTRVTVPVGEDIGFLPGTEEEKMTPWMGALIDNLEVLTQSLEHNDKENSKMAELLQDRIKIRSLNFMRGRTFLNKFIIIDEAQNLTSKQMQTLVTRAGPGTKIVCLGNINQIDTPYLTGTTSGLTYVVQCFKSWEHSGHITLSRGERSRLADHAIEVL